MNLRPAVKLGIFIASAVAFAVLAFWFGMGIGVKYGTRQLAVELNSTQAMLAFNRMQDNRKLNFLLSKGCVDEALTKTDIAIDQDKKLLASLLKEKLSPWLYPYISDRDPDFISSLEGFKSKYGNNWTENVCPKSK